MHIVLVNRWYPPQSYGGIAVYQQFLAEALVNLGHQVSVIAARSSAEIPEKMNLNGVTVYRVLSPSYYLFSRIPVLGRYARAVSNYRYSFQISKKLEQLKAEEKMDVVEFSDVEAEGFAYLKKKKRSPVIVRCHTPTFVLRKYYSPEEMPYDTNCGSKMEIECIRRADLLTAPSCDMARVISEACGIPLKEINVLPNLLDTNAYKVKRENRLKASTSIKIICVGRLDRLKGIEVLAKAIPIIAGSYPNVEFAFLGSDGRDSKGNSWKERLLQIFSNIGVGNKVKVLTNVNQEELLRWYREADIAVVPSLLYESFSYTCAQAMAAGLPVVASKIGGIPETVEDGVSGVLVDPGDAEALAKAILKLVSDPDLRKRMGEAGVKRSELFESLKIAKLYLEVISKRLSVER